jgi:transcriptional regulator with XRE-family HTH domain
MTQALVSGSAFAPDQICEMSSCRVILQQTLLTKQKKNSRYSLRAFARDLRVSPSFLSEVLNGKYGISRQLARQIAERLGFDARECDHFCELADLEITDSRTRKRGTDNRGSDAQSTELDVSEEVIETRFNDLRDTLHRLLQQSKNGTFMVTFRS